MRGREGAAQEQSAVEAPDPVIELDVLAIKDVGRRRVQFCRDEQVAGLDLFDAYRPQPLAPFVRDLEARPSII
jgi:hypothetical protein